MFNFSCNKKGFTLAELLVVIAIIAILVAIAIPVFSAQTRKAKEAVCTANRRSLKGELTVQYLMSDELFPLLNSNSDIEVTDSQLKLYKCPSEGQISARIEDRAIIVSCSIHGSYGYADKISSIILKNPATLTRKLSNGKTQTLAEYFERTDYAAAQINSETTEAQGAAESWTNVIKNKLGDLDQSWSLRMTDDGKGYLFTVTVNGKLTNADINKDVNVQLYYYDLSGKITSTTSSTSKVASKGASDKKYPIIYVKG